MKLELNVTNFPPVLFQKQQILFEFSNFFKNVIGECKQNSREVMSMVITLRVMFPGEQICPIRVKNLDTPQTVALSGPPLQNPVILLHNGKCLCPYLSLAAQGVVDNDFIVVHSIETEPPLYQEFPFEEQETGQNDNVFEEILRLADVAFIPYETSRYGFLVYEQMTTETKQDAEDDFPQEETHVTAKPKRISTAKLPICWEERKTRNQINRQACHTRKHGTR